MKKSIYMKGAYNNYNYGDDLLLYSVLYFWEHEVGISNAEVELSIDKQFESLKKLKLETCFDLNYFDDPLYFVNDRLKEKNINRVLKLFVLGAMLVFNIFACLLYKTTGLCLFNKKLFNFYKNVDIMYFIGGGYLTNTLKSSLTHLLYDWLTLWSVKCLNPNLRVVGTGMGIGPITNKIYGFVLDKFIRNFEQIYLREEDSLQLLKKMNFDGTMKNCGDDVFLLIPYFKKLQRELKTSEDKLALNLKNELYNDYNNYAVEISEIISYFNERGYKTEFCVFGHTGKSTDTNLLKLLDNKCKGDIRINNPYICGNEDFIKNMMSASCGFGASYHFNVMLSLFNIAVVGIYSCDYSKQKIKNVVEDLTNNALVIDINALKDKNVSGKICEFLGRSNTISNLKIDQKYSQIASEYKKFFYKLIKEEEFNENLICK